jgi:hypothetical protein
LVQVPHQSSSGSAVAACLSDERLSLHHKALRKREWFTGIDWESPIQIPEYLINTAWYITSQSSFAEQTGMLAAAILMIEAPDLATQLCYSTALQDEAIHIEAFSRSAVRLKGTVKPPDNHFREQRSIALNPESSYLTKLTIHTLLEGWATDEFAIFADTFKNDLLGEIYTRVYSDESRHVHIGLSCIRKLLGEPLMTEDFSLEEAEALAAQAAQLSEKTYAGLAKMSGRTPQEIRRWFDERHKSRMEQITFSNIPTNLYEAT